MNSIRVGVIWYDDIREDVSLLQVTMRIGANRSAEERLALQAFLAALKRLKEVSEPLLPLDRV